MSEDGIDFRDRLEENRVEIIKCLDIDRQFLLSHLRSKFVFDDEDCQIINGAGPSRQQKVSKFIDLLATKGPKGFQYFVDALEYEHGYLYELFTGKKPSSPSMQRFNYPNSSYNAPYSVLTDRFMIDSEREYLAEELEKSAGVTHTMAFMQNKLTKEKSEIEKQLFAAQQELQEKEILIEELKSDISVRDDIISKKTNSDDIQHYVMQAQQLIKENNEQSQIIIALQAQLLVCKDRIEENGRHTAQLKRKNENLMQHVKDLTINYDWQRRTSSRLSRQVDQNKDDLRKFSTTNKQIYELKFKLTRVTEERDEAQRRLRESQNSLEELSAQHEYIQKEIHEETEKRGKVSKEYMQMREKIKELRHKLFLESTNSEKFQRRNDRLVKEIETFKEQREFLLNERENLCRDIDTTNKTLRETEKFNQQLQSSRDEAVRKQIEISTLFEKRLMECESELEKAREELDHQIYMNENQENADSLPTSPLAKAMGASFQRDSIDRNSITRFSALALSSQAMLRMFRTLNQTRAFAQQNQSDRNNSVTSNSAQFPSETATSQSSNENDNTDSAKDNSTDSKTETRKRLSRQPAVRNTEKKKNPKYVTAFENENSSNGVEKKSTLNGKSKFLLSPDSENSRSVKNTLLQMNKVGLSISAPSLTSDV